ncbi:MAG: hypothetical protein QXM52_03770 [Candidatus Bathyarchaeia archaeon]
MAGSNPTPGAFNIFFNEPPLFAFSEQFSAFGIGCSFGSFFCWVAVALAVFAEYMLVKLDWWQRIFYVL